MKDTLQITAREALEELLSGNKQYIDSRYGVGDISKEKRRLTSLHGQSPYAIIVTCSDSRVIPENIFSAGIGELFVIRLAIGDETDAAKACELNVAHSIRIIEDSLEIHHMEEDTGLRVMGAIYDIESGEVRLL